MSGEEAIIAGMVVGTAFLVVRPLVSAIAKRIAGEHRPPVRDPDAALVEEIEHLRQDMNELQERVDFAERLLAKQRGAERLAPPG
jgi:uncharacterized protein YlxW (UPF0749 family)